MKYLVSFLLALSCGVVHAAPQEALDIALADAETLGRDGYYTRYLDGTHLTPDEWKMYERVAGRLHINTLSRSPRLYAPRVIGRMIAVDFRYLENDKDGYNRFHTVWERFAVREPYYHQKDLVEEVTQVTTDAYGRQVPGVAKKTKKVVFAAHLSPTKYAKLRTLTNSHTPIVTIDWFFAMTCVEVDRGSDKDNKFVGGGFGYYDFIGVASRDDFFKLAGVDLKGFRSQKSELLAVVTKIHSGVAQNDRMIVRRGSEDGFIWFTLDFFNNNLDDQSPLKILDRRKGLKHQAERHFATLPNGLAVVLACNAEGLLQVYAPAEVGPDHSAKGNDARIHPTKSCFSCHNNGFLKDINDEVRATYSYEPKEGYNLLTAVEKEDEQYLHAAYLRDFRAKMEADRKAYEQAVRECAYGDIPKVESAVKVASDEYREAYQQYVLEPMTLERVAAGLGVTPEVFKEKLKAYRKNDQLSSHILNPLSKGRNVTRDHYEELYPLLQQMTRGVLLP